LIKGSSGFAISEVEERFKSPGVAKQGPADAFAGADFDLATVRAGQKSGRISTARFADPLGVGKTPSRFSDPRRRKAVNRFAVLYPGSSLKMC